MQAARGDGTVRRMKPPGPLPSTPPAPGDALQRLLRDARVDLATAGGLVLLAAIALTSLYGLGLDYPLKAALLYALAAALVWRGLQAGPAPGPHPHRRFGAANRVTLGRLGVGMLLAALGGETSLGTPATLPAAWWAVIVVATVTAVSDAADGPLARRAGLASRYGARFDMETDAWFTLLLCGLVWQADQTGAWVLAAGLMRYAFVAAAWVWPWLDGPLPPSWRRQAVCVVQITTLIVCLGPIVSPLLATVLAAASLLLLTASFAIDIAWLARNRVRSHHPHHPPTHPLPPER
jgi:phosphatidylglycerophosphate synthase